MHCRGVLLVIGFSLVSGLAQAQFYDLDGAYRCVTVPDTASCQASASPPAPPPPPPAPAPPTVDEIIARIRTQAVTAEDMRLLTARAEAKEPRAVEALAWCRLNGIGGPADAIAAFLLYGQAAKLGIPTASANQVAIFETKLTPDQRQQALMRQQNQ